MKFGDFEKVFLNSKNSRYMEVAKTMKSKRTHSQMSKSTYHTSKQFIAN